jgi:ABC-type branched-subunit amino acid transport system substrate-binding protein
MFAMSASRSVLWIVPFVVALVGEGCGSTARAEPRYASSDPVAQQEFDRARALFQQGELAQAEPLFAAFVRAHGDDALRPAAELHLGRIAAARGDHEQAATQLERAAASSDQALADVARLELGRNLLRAGGAVSVENARRALEALEPLAGRLDGAEAAELYALLAEAAGAAGDAERRIRYLDAWCRYGGRDECEAARRELAETVTSLDQAQLARLNAALPRDGQGWATVTGRLGLMAADGGDAARAAALAAELDEAGHDADELRAATVRAEQLDWSAIGALLPLSGRARLVGEQVQTGLEMAAASSDDPLRLVVRDVAATGVDVGRMVEELVREERVAAIVGPVDAAQAQVAARRAEELGVPLLALTIRSQLATQGRWVLRPFQSNEAEVRLLLAQAIERQGLRTFAVLFPEQAYGRVLRDLVQAEVTRLGGTVAVAQGYDPARTSFVDLCQELATHDFEALIVPDRSRTVALIAPALASAGLWSVAPAAAPPEGSRAIQLLLPSTGFDASLPRQAGRYLQGALFATPLWVDDPAPDITQFVEEYRDAHGGAPTAYASQAHDAAALVRAARGRAAVRSREALLQALLALDEAPTIGRFEGFDAEGEPLAPLHLLRLDGSTFLNLSDATTP